MPGRRVLVQSLTGIRIRILTISRYTCTDQTPTFFGCCTSNPCNGVGCPSSDLRAAGMGTGSGPDFSVNDSSYWPNVFCAHGQWWTCAEQTPSFQGCCISNPCANAGCPMGNLFPAAFGTVSSTTPAPTSTASAWSSIQTTNSLMQTTSSSITSASFSTKSTSSSSTSTFQSTTLTTSAAMATTSSSSAHLPTPTPSPGPNIAAIAGGAAGGSFAGVLLLLIIAFVIWRCRRRRKSNASPESDPSNPRFGPKGPNSPYNDGQYIHSSLHEHTDSVDVDAYYPGQPGKPTQTPSPPSYQSPQRSPNRNQYTYEIDSTELHEIDGSRAPDPREINADGRIEGGAAHGLGLDHVAELPNNSRSLRMSR
jgi:hypothetical protein